MKRKFVLVVLTLLLGVTYAQQDPHFSHYMFNEIYNSPGYTGVEGVTRATLIHRSQWLTYQTTNGDPSIAPQTQIFSVNHPLKIMSSPVVNSGVGLIVVNDKLGDLKNLNIKGTYSYHYKLRNDATIGLGLSAGIYSQSVDGSVLRAAEEGDEVVDYLKTSPSQIKPDFGLGGWYETKKYYAGISLSHITGSSFSFGGNKDLINSSLVRHLYINGGYHIMLGTKLRVTPSAIIQTDFVETSYTYSAVLDLNRYKYWLGFGMRQSVTGKEDKGRQVINDDFIFMGGISLLEDKTLRIGYSFDLVTSGYTTKDNTSHEIMLSYILPFNANENPPPLRTPRYRHEN